MQQSNGFDLLQKGGDDIGYDGGNYTIVFDPPGKDAISVSVMVGEAIEDFLETGQVVWPAAPILAYFLLSDRGMRLIEGRSVIELGAGVGIPGILCRHFATRVVLTDHNSKVLDILNHNIELNLRTDQTRQNNSIYGNDCDISASSLDWASPPPSSLAGRFDVAIGADVVYAPGAAADLFATVNAVLSTSPAALFILAHVSRCGAAQTPALARRAHTKCHPPLPPPAGGRPSTPQSGPPPPPRAWSSAPPSTPPRSSRRAAPPATQPSTSSPAAARRRPPASRRTRARTIRGN